MNVHRICFAVLVVTLGWGPCVGAGFAANQRDGVGTQKHKLRTLLESDVQELLDDNPEHVLMFYESLEKALAASKENPVRKMFQLVETQSDPIMIAQFGEIMVKGQDLPLSQATTDFIEADPQHALDVAIELTQSEFSGPARMAAEVIRQYRDDLTEAQWKKILDGRQYVIHHRDKYPAGINTWANGFSHIPFGYVFFKDTEGRCVDSQTTYYVDGTKKYPRSTHGLGWRSDLGYVGFEKLGVGRHKIQLKTTYTFKLADIEFEGTNESKEIEIEITSEESPDHLAAVVDEKLVAEVEAAVVVGEQKDGKAVTYSKPLAGKKHQPYARIWVPAIKVASPISVSLQMKPEIYFEGEDKPLTRYVLRVPPGKTTTRVLENWVGDSKLAEILKHQADADGKVKAKLILQPSREHALSDPTVESYYPRAIEREIEFGWENIE